MDPTALMNNPVVKKLQRYFFLAVIVEIGVFVLVSYLIGFGTAFIIQLIITLVGYSIKPYKNPFAPKEQKSLLPGNPFSTFEGTRKLCGTLLMIPTFLTDVIGILLFLPPVQKLVVHIGKKMLEKQMKKMGMGGFDPSMFAKMAESMKASGMGANGFGGMGANGFGGMGANGFGAQSTAEEAKSASTSDGRSKTKRERHHKTNQHEQKPSQTIVDVDYEVRDGDGIWIGGHSEKPTDLAVAMKHNRADAKDDAKDDVIDVEGEWK